jgi:hypothetical protein
MKWQNNTKVASHIEERRKNSWAMSSYTQKQKELAEYEGKTFWVRHNWETYVEYNGKKYLQVFFRGGYLIYDVLEELKEMSNKGILLCWDLNGEPIFWDEIWDIDEKCRELWIETKEKWIQAVQAETQKGISDAVAKIPEWIARWVELVDTSKQEEWENYVNQSANTIYHWIEIDTALDFAKRIINGNYTIEEIDTEFSRLKEEGDQLSIIYIFTTFFTEYENITAFTTRKIQELEEERDYSRKIPHFPWKKSDEK